MGNEEERAHLHRDAVPLELLVYYHTIKTHTAHVQLSHENHSGGG